MKNYVDISSYLINERYKAVVETLDLFLFLGADSLDSGVNLNLQWRKQALVDGYSFNWSCMRSMADFGDGVGSQGHAAEPS